MTHAFALLRAYQHKIKHLGEPAAQEATQQAAHSCKRTILTCQHCSQPVLLTADNTALTPAAHNSQSLALHPNRCNQSFLDTDSECQQQQLMSVQSRQAAGHQQADGKAKDHTHPADVNVSRQEPFADLASEVLAWQHDDTVSEAAQQAAAQEACKVLRFDPSLGTDGAFYFIASQPLGAQIPAASEGMAAAGPVPAHPQAAGLDAWQQHPPSAGFAIGQHLQVSGAETGPTVASAAESDRQGDSSNASKVTGDKSSKGSIVQAPHALPESGRAQLASSESQHLHTHASNASIGAQQAQAQFPVQGGGEAGVLLRAAAAAAAGCSHDLVVAAAGVASPQARPISDDRYGH